jgi:hypothetical protein
MSPIPGHNLPHPPSLSIKRFFKGRLFFSLNDLYSYENNFNLKIYLNIHHTVHVIHETTLINITVMHLCLLRIHNDHNNNH